MSFGKMVTCVNIITSEPNKDAEGFVSSCDTILASVRAYKEDRHGNEKWANRAAFSTATSLFRFRIVPGLTITTDMSISCADGRYNIVSVENIKNKNLYVEALASKAEPSVL